MIDDLKPYPAMKDSGVPWLGEVPEHWSIARSKRLFRQRKEFARPEDQQLSATQAYGVIPQAIYESRTGYKVVKISLHLEKRRHVEADDFVISMRSFEGGLERAWSPGAIRSSYVVLKPSNEVHPDFFQYFFKSSPYIAALRGTADFIRDGQDLNFDNFCNVALPLIPPQEQTAIAHFLNHADRKIRRYIRAKQKLIKLLEEQKQAIIHRAVTRGLDPNVRLKASGVEWLGDVPEHWEVKKVRQCGAISGGMTPSMAERSLWDGDIPWVTPKDMKRFTITRASMTVSARALEATSLKLLPAESVLLVVRGMILARRVPIARTTAPVTINQDMKAIVPSADITAGFLAYLMDSAQDAYRPLIDEAGHGTKRFPTERLKDVVLAIPPAVEQSMIVRHLDQATAHIADSLDSVQHQITLLREYRTRLIADVVTGKLDVREAAAGLPEEEPVADEALSEPYDQDDAEDSLEDESFPSEEE